MIHKWKKALLGCAADIYGRASPKPAEVDAVTALLLRAKLVELAGANDHSPR